MKQFEEYANIYDELFSSINDYEKEVDFYDKILKKYNCKTILEVGCGCGHRGQYFIKKGYDYTGLDISKGMLKIAKKKYPKIKFLKGDIMNIKIKRKFDAILFLGKGSVYLNENKDVINALQSIKKIIKKGLVIIDVFDANKIIPHFKSHISWSKKMGNKTIIRKSKNVLDLETGWTWMRNVSYIVKDKNKKTKVYKDGAILRAFTRDELKIFYALVKIPEVKFIRKNDTLISIGIIR